ncbi:carboxymuconolactone decarboxylase family protein [Hyphomonas sp.]|uniref:carboxymuconolactone decarboxylase family protein n=1 Tax=Hyphomonas sp. TaxID=87 RepID=UPI0039196A4B
MSSLIIHDETTAPEAAKAALAGVRKSFGFVPNVLGELAANPAVLDAYLSLAGFAGKAGLTAQETQVVQIAVSVENECHFCVAAHTAMATGQALDDAVIAAVRERRPIGDARLEALRVFTQRIVNQRGFVSDADVTAFRSAGWSDAAMLAVILNAAMKTITNYVNHIAETPLNPEFEAYAWTPGRKGTVLA